MFTIKPLPTEGDAPKLLLQGATFAYFGVPLKFEFSSDVVSDPVELSLVVIKDVNRPSGIFMGDIKVDGIKAKALLEIVNPPKGTATNVNRQPIAALAHSNGWLGINFFIAEFPDVAHFLFYYEFYEGTDSVAELLKPIQKASTGAPV
jgi:hypothetical protein